MMVLQDDGIQDNRAEENARRFMDLTTQAKPRLANKSVTSLQASHQQPQVVLNENVFAISWTVRT